MSKHAWLYTLLDALDLYETWFVATEEIGGRPNALARIYNSRGKAEMRYLSVDKGILFVRVA